MKLIFTILAAALLTGCRKPELKSMQWSYRTIELENGAHDIMNRTPVGSQGWIEEYQRSKTTDGFFTMSDDQIDKLGKEGWELVAAIPQIETVDAGKYPNTRTAKIILIFKKPL